MEHARTPSTTRPTFAAEIIVVGMFVQIMLRSRCKAIHQYSVQKNSNSSNTATTEPILCTPMHCIPNRLLKRAKPHFSIGKTEVRSRILCTGRLPCGHQIHKKSSPGAQKTFIFLGKLRHGRGYFAPVDLLGRFMMTKCIQDRFIIGQGKLG